MSALERCDVVVVGGGPAGAGAALSLARAGARTVLLERAEPPRYKTCGGGLIGRTLRRLPVGLGLEPDRTLNAVELGIADAGLRFVVERDEPVVAMTMRSALDAALVERAAAVGADVRTSCAYEGHEDGPDAVRVTTARGILLAEAVVAADGVLSAVARCAGLEPGSWRAPALEAELDVSASALARFGDRARFDLGIPSDGYAWVFPKRAHLSVGVLSTCGGRVHLREALDAYLRRLGMSGEVRHADVHGSLIPLAPRPGGPAKGRVLLAGDALGLADPITAEGISDALLSGDLCGAAWIAARGDGARLGKEYARRVQVDVLRDLGCARVLARGIHRAPRLRRALFRARGATLAEAMVEVVLGNRRYREIVSSPASYWKLLRTSKKTQAVNANSC